MDLTHQPERLWDAHFGIVLGGHITGLAVLRSLGRRGVPTVVVDDDEYAPAFVSRFATLVKRVPDVVVSEERAIDELISLGAELEKPGVLLPTSDQWMLAIARHAEILSRYFILPPSDYATVIRIVDKRILYEEAVAFGIPVPDYAEIAVDRPDEWEQIPFPCVIKPALKGDFVERFGQSAIRVNDLGELKELMGRAKGYSLIQQSMVSTGKEGLRTVAVYLDRRGELKGCLHACRGAVYPPDVGSSCLVRTCEEQILLEETCRFLRYLNYKGVAEVEYVFDERRSLWQLIDVNPRFWKWSAMPVEAGVDFPWLAYCDAIGRHVEYQDVSRKVTWLSLLEMAGLFDQVGPSFVRRACSDITSESDRLLVDALFSLDDPLPAVQTLSLKMASSVIACKC